MQKYSVKTERFSEKMISGGCDRIKRENVKVSISLANSKNSIRSRSTKASYSHWISNTYLKARKVLFIQLQKVTRIILSHLYLHYIFLKREYPITNDTYIIRDTVAWYVFDYSYITYILNIKLYITINIILLQSCNIPPIIWISYNVYGMCYCI